MALKMEAVLGILAAGLLFGRKADPTLVQGVALLESGDAAGAVNVLKAVTSREPRNGRAWRNLGVALSERRRCSRQVLASQRPPCASIPIARTASNVKSQTHGKPIAVADCAALVKLGPVVCQPGIAESGAHPVATKGADPDRSRSVHDRIA